MIGGIAGPPLIYGFVIWFLETKLRVRITKARLRDVAWLCVAGDQALGNFEERRKRDEARAVLSSLTSRQREVFGLVATGHTSKAIAQQLDITVKTIEVHRSRVMGKLGATNLAEVIELFRAAEQR